jgi:3-oxoacyl-[acyl-carrier-protein] synthase III
VSIARIAGVKITGIASAVPRSFLTIEDDGKAFGQIEMAKIGENTGVKKRHVATGGMCTSDLCFAAAQKLLAELNWAPESVDALVFVSQSPDYQLPATACVLQMRLGLSKGCAAFDISLGCSGYTYGLWVVSSLIAGGGVKRALLLAGDVSAGGIPVKDRHVAGLFGDAGSATALEYQEGSGVMTFDLGTDGSGWHHLMMRNYNNGRPARQGAYGEPLENFSMDGGEIFTFTIREIPALVKRVMAAADLNLEKVDAFVMHQANTFILKHLAKKMKVPLEQLPFSMDVFGNTSSASIPLTINHCLAERLSQGPMHLVMAGFGVGLSWAGVAVTLGPLVVPPVILVDPSIVPEHV